MNHRYRIGVDVGGTFTDIVLLGTEGRLKVKKVSSTPGHYEEAIVTGIGQILEEAGIAPQRIREVCHSTTAATNAVLERRGAKVGLITTQGFRDVLELRRLRTPTLYDLFYTPPEPLVPRYLRLEVNERIDAQGRVLQPLDLDEARDVMARLKKEGVDSIAVCLLNSYINPVHELAIGGLLRAEYRDLAVSLSCEVMPAIREYERTSTTVANAYIMPVMNAYLRSLRERLSAMGIGAPISVMQSSGGMMTAQVASERPILCLESGPVAGVAGAMRLSRELGLSNVLTLDMGGTTTKAAVIENNEAHRSTEYEIGAPISRGSRLLKGGGYLLMVRAVDVAEVGAGGGSIVAPDGAGSFRVGPRSAGAVPGPVCYDRGGTELTISDANLLLGYLNPHYLLGGALKVNRDKTARYFQSQVATPLDLPLLEAAHGAHLVANATMARALRAVSTERGRDVRQFTLVAFGGSGPVHAAALARYLQIGHVVIPAAPGLFSSLGLLSAPQEYEFVRSLMVKTKETERQGLEEHFNLLETEARNALKREGYSPHTVAFTRYADMHYAGQIHELTVPVSATGGLAALEEVFGDEHLRTYGYLAPREPIEITNVRVLGRLGQSHPAPTDLSSIGGALYEKGSRKTNRKAYFGRKEGLVETPVLSRADLDSSPCPGPLIVEEYDTTIVVPPGWAVSRDTTWNVHLQWG